jgi:hypothetical protein
MELSLLVESGRVDPCNDALAQMVHMHEPTRLAERVSQREHFDNYEPHQVLDPTAMSIIDVHVRIANEDNASIRI